MTDSTGATHLSITDIVRRYHISHAKLYRLIKNGTIPATALDKQKSKGRQGWRHVVAADAVAALALAERVVPVVTPDVTAVATA
jgi:hypothetical protein